MALSFEMNLFQTLTVKLKLLGHHGFSRTGTKRSHLQNSRLRNLPSQMLRSRRRQKKSPIFGDRFHFFPYHMTSLQPYHLGLQRYHLIQMHSVWHKTMIVCHSCKRRVVACSTGGTSAGLGDAEGGSWLSNGNMEKAWETPGAKGVRET